MSKYERQIKLNGFGVARQQQLQHAKILIVGAGGLGCPALLFLAGSGVGHLTIVDGDCVSLSNLSRQILFSEADVGRFKAKVASDYINTRYSDINAIPFTDFLSTENIIKHVSAADLVLDCTDNFESRYLINDACKLLNKPLIFGAVYKNEGQVAVFNVADSSGFSSNYRNLFPQTPGPSEIPDCSETGVMSVLTGIIGGFMAAEAIKLITGYGSAPINTIMHYNLLSDSFYKTKIANNNQYAKAGPATIEELMQAEYKINCTNVKTVSWYDAFAFKDNSGNNCVFVDVRELNELPPPEFDCLKLPMSQNNFEHPLLSNAHAIFVFCQSGIRSRVACRSLSEIYKAAEVKSVEGGVLKLHSDKSNYQHES